MARRERQILEHAVHAIAEQAVKADELVASHRSSIEASGMRVLGEPEIRRVPNDRYITTPDAPSECYLVIFQVGPAESL
jgi:hypothetical protein